MGGLVLGVIPARADTVVGSKAFTESVILGEMARIALEDAGVAAEHRRQLGGSRILFDAVRAGEVDLYPDYTGTLRFEILSTEKLAGDGGIAAALARQGLAVSKPIGFSNGYALAMRPEVAERHGLRTISDLARHPELRVAVSNEFVDRADGWRALSAAYGLGAIEVRGIDHDLAYRALADGQIDVIDVYTTDAEIAAHGLTLLEDDRRFFPAYDAVFVYRSDLDPRAVAALDALAGRIDERAMQRLNRMVVMDGASERAAARAALGLAAPQGAAPPGLWQRIGLRTIEHLRLVAIALAGALVVAIPLGVLAARSRRIGALVIPATGLLQTIPSLALFVMLIPLLGIGAAPTIAALFLYSLLPIVRNVHAGLTGIARPLRESAEALGLSTWARLRRIELPLALPTIMAGVRTAAVIAVGLATLGAIIGAGGYGQPILTGIRLNNTATILEGAVPAALLALAIEGAFHLVEAAVVPRGLRPAR
ncbi:amino acid ABC transporter permease [Novosphingobium sp. PC22D]|nr:amino acid ABC transporter permease [Novosphingobium sp. PC22D]